MVLARIFTEAAVLLVFLTIGLFFDDETRFFFTFIVLAFSLLLLLVLSATSVLVFFLVNFVLEIFGIAGFFEGVVLLGNDTNGDI